MLGRQVHDRGRRFVDNRQQTGACIEWKDLETGRAYAPWLVCTEKGNTQARQERSEVEVTENVDVFLHMLAFQNCRRLGFLEGDNFGYPTLLPRKRNGSQRH